MATNGKPIIGRAEEIDILDLGLSGVPAKVDTGADSSSIWVSSVIEKGDELHCVFFGPDSPFYTGETVVISKGFRRIWIANSFGEKELRHRVKLRIRVKGRLIRATFTLSDRSKKPYPVLLGRRMLQGKFLVNVAHHGLTVEQVKAERIKRDLYRAKHHKEVKWIL